MDRDTFDGPVAHTTVISHNILNLLDSDFLELCFLNKLSNVLGRINEFILVNEVEYGPLYCSSFNLFLFHFLIRYVVISDGVE